MRSIFSFAMQSTTIFFYADYTRKNLMAYATKISDAVQQSSDNGVYIR